MSLIKVFIYLVLIISLLPGCRKQVLKSCDVILYSIEKYSPNTTVSVTIVDSRLDIPEKYKEIGVIKKGIYCSIGEIRMIETNDNKPKDS